MTEISAPRAPTREPTPYGDLNTVLATLVERVQGLLGDNFVAAYLQGSFAVGDFDPSSDVDVTIAIREDIADEDLPALQALHGKLFDETPAPWGQRLELSYFPLEILKRYAESPRDPPDAEPRPDNWKDPATGSKAKAYPLLYLDNGGRTLVRSEHDNTRVVRWTVRERGIVLAGPDPRELIDVVTPIALRAEVRGLMQGLAARCLADPRMMAQRWVQAFFVTLFCRMQHSLVTGTVSSKVAATAWATDAFALRWNALIRRALVTRTEPLEARMSPTPRGEVQETQAFIREVLRQDAPKKPKPKRRGPKPGFTFNALVPGQPEGPPPPAKRAPGKRPSSKGPPSKGGSFSKDKRPYSKDGPPRDGAEKRPYAKSGPPRDGGSKRPYSRDGAPAKAPYAREASAREGGEARSYSRDAAPRDGAEKRPYSRDRGPARAPYAREGGPRDGGEKRPYSRDGAPAKAPYSRDAKPRDGAEKRSYSRDGATKAPYSRDPSKGPPKDGAERRAHVRELESRGAKGPQRGNAPPARGYSADPSKGPTSRGGPPKRPSGGRPPPKR